MISIIPQSFSFNFNSVRSSWRCIIFPLDIYLLGTVMLVFGMGLYELFISNLDKGKSMSGETTPYRSNLFGMFTLKVSFSNLGSVFMSYLFVSILSSICTTQFSGFICCSCSEISCSVSMQFIELPTFQWFSCYVVSSLQKSLCQILYEYCDFGVSDTGTATFCRVWAT